MAINKLLLGSVILLLCVVAYLVYYIQKPSVKPAVESAQITEEFSEQKIEPTSTPSPETTPKAPQIQPINNNISDRAYKAAAFFIANLHEASKKKIKISYETENMTDTELVKAIAQRLNGDTALLAQVEAEIQKISTQRTQEVVQANDDSSECQLKLAKYTACMSEYSAKVSEYSACVSEKASNPYKACFQPFNACGVKPVCL